jgi:hypothetical protein
MNNHFDSAVASSASRFLAQRTACKSNVINSPAVLLFPHNVDQVI